METRLEENCFGSEEPLTRPPKRRRTHAEIGRFNNVTLDGYFSGIGGDISWAHKGNEDAEWNAFVADNASAGGMLLLGRITYELMASYWPTPAAMKNYPDVTWRRPEGGACGL